MSLPSLKVNLNQLVFRFSEGTCPTDVYIRKLCSENECDMRRNHGDSWLYHKLFLPQLYKDR